MKGRAEPPEIRGEKRSKNSKSGRVSGLVPTEITTAIKQTAVTFQRTEKRTQQWRSGPTVKAPVTLEGLDMMATIDTGAMVSIVSLPFLMQPRGSQNRHQRNGSKGDVNRRQWKFVCSVEKCYQSRLKQRSLLPMELTLRQHLC